MSFKIPLTVGKLITKFLSSHAEHQMSIKLTIQVTRIYGRIYKYGHKKKSSHTYLIFIRLDIKIIFGSE